MIKIVQSNPGFIALSAVLVIMSVIVAVVATVALLSIGEAQSSLAVYLGEDNLQLVEGCTEDAMLKIRSNSSYAGGTITRPEGTCAVVIVTGNPNWDITITAAASPATGYQRKIESKFVRSGTGITLTSWQEI